MHKKLFHISVIILLLVSTTGVTIAQHFCGGTLRYMEVTMSKSAASCCGDIEMESDCCNNEVEIKVVQDNFTQVISTPSFDLEQLDVISDVIADDLPHPNHETRPNFAFKKDSSPALGIGVSVPVLNQSFLN